MNSETHALPVKLCDKVVWVPKENLEQLLLERAEALHHISNYAMEEAVRTEIRVALQGLVKRVAIELERLASTPHDAENAARAVRNCLETNLIGRYILESSDNLRNWFSLRAQEEIDVLSAHLKVFAQDSHLHQREPLESRILELQAVLTKQEAKPTRLPRWSQLAAKYNLKDDYDALYGLFSKYVHPSAWLIVKPDRGWAATFTEAFVIHAQLYALDLTVRSLEALGLDDSVFLNSPWDRNFT